MEPEVMSICSERGVSMRRMTFWKLLNWKKQLPQAASDICGMKRPRTLRTKSDGSAPPHTFESDVPRGISHFAAIHTLEDIFCGCVCP